MTIISDLKEIGRTLQEAGKIELYQQVLDFQADLLELQDKLREEKEKNRILTNKLERKESLIFRDDAYWVVNKDGVEEGPFCSICWDSNEKLIRQRVGDYIGGWALCLHCKNLAIHKN